jgi:hypothetical protein
MFPIRRHWNSMVQGSSRGSKELQASPQDHG